MATIEKRSFDLSRERTWILRTLAGGYADSRRSLWLDGEGLSERGRQLLSALEGAAAEGFDPDAYGIRPVRQTLDAVPTIPEEDSVGRIRALADVEIRLSVGLLSYARDLVLGRLDPARTRQDWRVEPEPLPPDLLGRVKFAFPNPYDIYLHDTPDDHLFGRSHRAFSHGCIRLERPLELARHLVERHTGRSAGDVDRIVESGRTVTIELDRPMDVYVVYVTAWVEDHGTVRFYRDIYDRDAALRRMVSAPRSPRQEGEARRDA